MEMTYDGALVLPKNYVVMDEDDMMYVEGGGTGQVVAYQAIKIGVNMVFNSVLGGGTLNAVSSILRSLGTDYVVLMMKRALVKWVSARVANFIAGGIIGRIFKLATYTIGGAAAEILDRADGADDNQVYFSQVSF